MVNLEKFLPVWGHNWPFTHTTGVGVNTAVFQVSVENRLQRPIKAKVNIIISPWEARISWSARKRGWPSGGWFSFCVWLVERMERFLSQGAVEPKQTQIALNTSIEISLFKQHNYLTNLFVIHQDQCGKRITSSCVGLQDFSVYIFVRISETITPPKSQ